MLGDHAELAQQLYNWQFIAPAAEAPTEEFERIILDEQQPSFKDRVANILHTARTEFHEGGQRIRKVAVGAGVVALQASDRARAAAVFVPAIAVDVFNNTQSPAAAGVAAGLAYGAWCVAVGGATTEGLDQFPKTVSSFNQNFPSLVGFFEDALPGFEKAPQQPEAQSANVIRRIGSRAILGAKRGFSVVGIGTTAYVSTAAAKGKAKGETHRLNFNASVDGAAAIGAFVMGLGETIKHVVAPESLALAGRIENDASNIRVWYGVALGLMALQFAQNKWKSHRERRRNIESMGYRNY